ncbi:MAG: TIGR00296 family protein [Candidatus Micrarchaeia archaeon]
MKFYDLKDGEILVKSARKAIENYIKYNTRSSIDELNKFKDQVGVFVTLEKHPTNDLRGCIGFPIAVAQLKDMIIDASIAAAVEDPRFMPLKKEELDKIVIEVNILSEPTLIKKPENIEDIIKEIKVGRDGLLIKYGYYSGLLLPIVAVEEQWDEKTFLENVCIKAGLDTDAWKNPKAKLYKFESQVFKEAEPNGKVYERNFEK